MAVISKWAISPGRGHSMSKVIKQYQLKIDANFVLNLPLLCRCSKDSNESSNSQFVFKRENLPSNKGRQLKELDSYFDKLHLENEGQRYVKQIEITGSSTKYKKNNEKIVEAKLIQFKKLENSSDMLLFDDESFINMQNESEDSDYCLINLLSGINIAVMIFEIASPIRNIDLEYVSLPLFYGAKINKLILLGEWWRLLTPMFLHSGILHVAVGCWAMLTIGPRVCKSYGPLAFFLIYVLGGVSANFTSFLHTPDLTVCGTGPVFAVIGAWLVYQFQNKEVIPKDVSESMFWISVTVTALSFLLSGFGRIDNWSHIAGIVSGLVFGYLTCPTLELDNNAKEGQKEGFAIVQMRANPCKSIAIFTASIFVLTSLLAYGMQPELLEFE